MRIYGLSVEIQLGEAERFVFKNGETASVLNVNEDRDQVVVRTFRTYKGGGTTGNRYGGSVHVADLPESIRGDVERIQEALRAVRTEILDPIEAVDA